MTIDLIGV